MKKISIVDNTLNGHSFGSGGTLHFKKIFSPMYLTDAGMLKGKRCEHSRNAFDPINRTDDGIVILVSEAHD